MRSIETLVREFPEKTGAEILAIQEQDKISDQKEHDRIHAKELAWIKDINENGGFYKGRFGPDQRFFYNVTNAKHRYGTIICDVETIVAFFGSPNGTVREGEIRIEKMKKKSVEERKYMFDSYERITKKEWDKVNAYLDGLKKFWE